MELANDTANPAIAIALASLEKHQTTMVLDTTVVALEAALRRHIVDAGVHPLLVVLLDKFSELRLCIAQGTVLTLTHVATVLHGLEERLTVRIVIANPRTTSRRFNLISGQQGKSARSLHGSAIVRVKDESARLDVMLFNCILKELHCIFSTLRIENVSMDDVSAVDVNDRKHVVKTLLMIGIFKVGVVPRPDLIGAGSFETGWLVTFYRLTSAIPANIDVTLSEDAING